MILKRCIVPRELSKIQQSRLSTNRNYSRRNFDLLIRNHWLRDRRPKCCKEWIMSVWGRHNKDFMPIFKIRVNSRLGQYWRRSVFQREQLKELLIRQLRHLKIIRVWFRGSLPFCRHLLELLIVLNHKWENDHNQSHVSDHNL